MHLTKEKQVNNADIIKAHIDAICRMASEIDNEWLNISITHNACELKQLLVDTKSWSPTITISNKLETELADIVKLLKCWNGDWDKKKECYSLDESIDRLNALRYILKSRILENEV